MCGCHAAEAERVLADRRAAADADVLGDRLDEVHGAVDVEGGARKHAAQGPAGEAGRVATAQVNEGGYGTCPAVRSHLPSLRMPQPDRRTVRMLDSSGWGEGGVPLRGQEPQIRCDAICAPATRASNWAKTISGAVRLMRDVWAKPQSAPPMMFSGPRSFANRSRRWATSLGCSTVVMWWLMTPGMRILPSGSFVCSHTSHSHSCRGLAASMEYAPAFTWRMRSMIASSGASATCGTCQLPKQTW